MQKEEVNNKNLNSILFIEILIETFETILIYFEINSKINLKL